MSQIPITLRQRPTIQNRANAMNDALCQEIRHRWPMDRTDEAIAIAYVLHGWHLALIRTMHEDSRALVEKKAQEFAAEFHRERPEAEAVDANGVTVQRTPGPED